MQKQQVVRPKLLSHAFERLRSMFFSVSGFSSTEPVHKALDHMTPEDLHKLYLELFNVITPRCDEVGEKYGIPRVTWLRHVATLLNINNWDVFQSLLCAAIAPIGDEIQFWYLAYYSGLKFYRHEQEQSESISADYNAQSIENVGERRRCKRIGSEMEYVVVDIPTFHHTFFSEFYGLAQAILDRFTHRRDPLWKDGWLLGGLKSNADLTDPHSIIRFFWWLDSEIQKQLRKYHKKVVVNRSIKGQWVSYRNPINEGCQLELSYVENVEEYEEEIRMFGTRNPFHAPNHLAIVFYRAVPCGHLWDKIMVVGEVKSDPKFDMQSICEIGRDARTILESQPGRRFVQGFTVCGNMMRVVHIDRLGCLTSPQIDISKSPLEVISVMLGFMLKDRKDIGFDPSISTNKEGQLCISADGQKSIYIVDGIVCMPKGVAGRGTTCWVAHSEETPNDRVVIKDSWVSKNSEMEGTLIRRASRVYTPIECIVDCISHEVLSVDDRVDDVRESVRRGMDIRGGKMIRLVEGLEVDTLWEDNRSHQRIVLNSHGRSIRFERYMPTVLKVFEDCIKAHLGLYEAGILHRDISPHNILIQYFETRENEPRGLLIDLDLAGDRDRLRLEAPEYMVGTRLFMASELLIHPAYHTFRHDLESFWWSLVWVCFVPEDIGIIEPGRLNPFDEWASLDNSELAFAKMEFVASFGEGNKRVEKETHKQLNNCLVRLRDFLFKYTIPGEKGWQPDYDPRRNIDEKPHKQVYVDMLAILRSERDKLSC